MKWRYRPHRVSGDCVIRALACATNRSYEECEEELRSIDNEFRRSVSYLKDDGLGIHPAVNDAVYRAYGFKYIEFEYPRGIADVVQQYPNCIMVTSMPSGQRRSEYHNQEHTVAVKRGRLYDNVKRANRDRDRAKDFFPIVIGVYVRRRNRRKK